MYLVRYRNADHPDHVINAREVREDDQSYRFIRGERRERGGTTMHVDLEVAIIPRDVVQAIVLIPDATRDEIVKTVANAIGYEMFNDDDHLLQRDTDLTGGERIVRTSDAETDRCLAAAERVLRELESMNVATRPVE